MRLAGVIISLAVVNLSLGVKPGTKELGCYFEGWSFYRNGEGHFDVDLIDANLCTLGFYAFADMDQNDYKVKSVDPWYDLADGDPGCPWQGGCKYAGYRRFVALKDKNPDFKPILSIGGWNAGSEKYSIMAADPAKRLIFIDSIVQLMNDFGFEGADLDWEYPGIREGSDPEHDKDNYEILAQELSDRLHQSQRILTAALGCGWDKIEAGYDIPSISASFDYMNLMGYDFHGAWDTFTGHHSPLYPRAEEQHPGHPGYKYNIYDCVKEYETRGAIMNKLIMGMPTYGRGFILDDTSKMGIYCPAGRGSPVGPYSQQEGILYYNEIQELIHSDGTYNGWSQATPGMWVNIVDSCYHSPYLLNGPYWIGYDDEKSIGMKAMYVNYMELAGAMVWAIDTDDFKGTYSDAPYPLVRSIFTELEKGTKFNPEVPSCGSAMYCEIPYTPPPFQV